MKDVIRIQGMSFYGYHGVTAAERQTGRGYEVDCEFEVDFAEPGQTDDLTDTVDYEAVYNLIKDVVEGQSFALLERLATNLAIKLLDTFPIYRVTLQVRKMSPPIAGQIRFIEAEITRQQVDVSKLMDNDTRD